MSRVTIPKSNDAAICFLGDLIASAERSDKKQVRTYTVKIYRSSQHYAWSVNYRTTWDGEIDFDWGGIAVASETLCYALRSINPVPPRSGFPPGEKYAERQAEFVRGLNSIYLAAVGEALDKAGIMNYVPIDPSELDPDMKWNVLAVQPSPGRACYLRWQNGDVTRAVPVQSFRAPGQLAWDVGGLIPYATNEIVSWAAIE